MQKLAGNSNTYLAMSTLWDSCSVERRHVHVAFGMRALRRLRSAANDASDAIQRLR
jgi:hypothetical protein